jgi:hypothetical protein
MGDLSDLWWVRFRYFRFRQDLNAIAEGSRERRIGDDVRTRERENSE